MATPADRQVLLVAALFAVTGTAAVVLVASGSIVGATLSGDDALATVPVALGVVGLVAASWPASKAMGRWGRRRGFQLFTVIGLAGGLLCAWAARMGDFKLFCAGSFLAGMMGGAGQYYRFTAGEVADQARRERAIGYVLAGGVVGGLAGPMLAAWGEHGLGGRFVGTYLAVAALAGLALLLLPFLKATSPAVVPAGGHARLHVDRAFIAAVLAGALAYGGMVLTMYAAPLSLSSHGHDFATSTRVLQAHVVAMFLPSFVTGALVARVGPGRGMAAGIAFFAACIAANVVGESVWHHGVALVLLGLGWNLLFVSATALLARSHAGADKASAQGTNELLVGASSAAAAFLAGPAHDALGWGGLNLAVAALVCVVSVALLALHARPARKGEPPAAAPTSP